MLPPSPLDSPPATLSKGSASHSCDWNQYQALAVPTPSRMAKNSCNSIQYLTPPYEISSRNSLKAEVDEWSSQIASFDYIAENIQPRTPLYSSDNNEGTSVCFFVFFLCFFLCFFFVFFLCFFVFLKCYCVVLFVVIVILLLHLLVLLLLDDC